MLGIGKRDRSLTSWCWDVAGKHPAARDFFVLGESSLMAGALTEWVRRGAEELIATSKEMLTRSCSWRFWVKAPQGGMLACGIIRNSCDAVGRPFPLLFVGTGNLEKWENHWELLPLACEGLWCQMELLASKKYQSLERLQGDVGMLRPPLKGWKELSREKNSLAAANESAPGFSFHPVVVEEQEALFLFFDETRESDLFAMMSCAHSLLKNRVVKVPNALFMGGLENQPSLVLFRRPLSGQDFVRIWVPEIK